MKVSGVVRVVTEDDQDYPDEGDAEKEADPGGEEQGGAEVSEQGRMDHHCKSIRKLGPNVVQVIA